MATDEVTVDGVPARLLSIASTSIRRRAYFPAALSTAAEVGATQYSITGHVASLDGRISVNRRPFHGIGVFRVTPWSDHPSGFRYDAQTDRMVFSFHLGPLRFSRVLVELNARQRPRFKFGLVVQRHLGSFGDEEHNISSTMFERVRFLEVTIEEDLQGEPFDCFIEDPPNLHGGDI